MLRLTESDLEALKAKGHVREHRINIAEPQPRPRKRKGAPVVVPKQNESRLEIQFARQLDAYKVKPWQAQYPAIPGRKFLLDFAWPEDKVAVLVQGNVHRIKSKFYRDCALYCLLTMLGWRYLPLSRNEVVSAKGVKWVKELLG